MRRCASGGVRPAFCVFSALSVFAVLFLWLPGSAPAYAQAQAQGQSPNTELATVLALPMSPGLVALLSEHPTEALAQQRVKEALADARPEVRTVAARVIFDMGMRGLLPDVQAALAREQDAVAGGEELRAWMTLAPSPATYAACVQAAVRLSHPALATLIDTFARLNAPEVLTYIHPLSNQPGLANAIMTVTETDPAARARAARDLASNPDSLDPLLVAMHKTGEHPPSDLIVSLLQSQEAKVRVVGIWYLALCLGTDGRALTPEIKAALDPLIDANPTQVTWEALGLELLSRAEGRKPRERRWTDLAKILRPASAFHAGDEPLFLRLTSTELGDYYEATGNNRSEARESLAMSIRRVQSPPASRSDAAHGPPAWATPNVGVRTVPPFVGGLWTDLLQLTGCRPQPGFGIGADIAYRPDGRPLQIKTGDTNAPAPCVRFARLLFSLVVADEPRPRLATFSDVVVLALQAETLACADRAVPRIAEDTRRRTAPAAGERPEVPSSTVHTVTQPKRTTAVKPMYTEEARRRRLEGDVVVAATLTSDGCMSQATVMTSPSPMLSGPALYTILEWRYTPPILDGTPTSMAMTVTVHFALQ